MTACRLCGGDPSAPIAVSWEFFLPMDAPSQNVVAGNKRAGRFAYRDARNDFELLVMAEARRLRIPPASRRRRITLTRLFTGQRARARDRGNLIGGMKPLLDAFVRNRLLVDDREAYCEDYYHQRRHQTQVGVIVLLEEFDS